MERKLFSTPRVSSFRLRHFISDNLGDQEEIIVVTTKQYLAVTDDFLRKVFPELAPDLLHRPGALLSESQANPTHQVMRQNATQTGDDSQVRPRTVEPRQTSAGVDGNSDSTSIYTRPATTSDSNSYSDLGAQARKTLKLAITSTKFKRWSRPIHGLSVATSTPKEIGDGRAIVVLAVSNVLPEPLRIVPGQPELAIETRDDNGKPGLVERIKPLHIESSAMDNSIPAGATLYYAIVYQQPVLGVRQHVRAFVGQINAADDPAVADLSASKR